MPVCFHFPCRHDASRRMRLCLLLVTASAVSMFSSGQAAERQSRKNSPAAAAAMGNDINQIATAAAEAVAETPVLAGAYLDVDFDEAATADGERRFVFRRVLDPAKSDEQRAALDRLMQGLVPSGRYRVDDSADRTFPYSDLASHLRDLIRSDKRFPGCEFLGGNLRINTTSNDLEFLPRFRVARDGQFDALTDVCRRFLSRRPETAKIVVRDDSKAQKMVVAERPDPELNQVFAKLQQATRGDVALHGAAIDVEIDDQGQPGVAPKIYVFRRTLDRDRARDLSIAIDQLTRQLIPSGRIRFDVKAERTLPVSALLNAMQREVDIDPMYAGCTVSHISLAYSNDGSQIDVVIHGRVWKPAQVELLADLGRRLMRQDSSWESASAVLQTANREDLAVTTPSPLLAGRYYGEAMKLFYAGNYESADKWLALASVEDPTNVVYRYWRVLGLMARGYKSAAEERLAKTIRGLEVRPHSQAHIEVMHAIYRVQGPLRHELIDMERRIMAMDTLALPFAN